ncbi:hypothetical protein LINPERHAP1_LOCUS26745 [Linum perenne]
MLNYIVWYVYLFSSTEEDNPSPNREPATNQLGKSQVTGDDSFEKLTLGPSKGKASRPVPIPPSSKMAGLSLSRSDDAGGQEQVLPLSLKLSTSSPPEEKQSPRRLLFRRCLAATA